MSHIKMVYDKDKDIERDYKSIYKSACKTIQKKEIARNMKSISMEMDWLCYIICDRLQNLLESRVNSQSVYEIQAMPELGQSSYHDFIREHELTYIERLLLILTFAAYFEPKCFRYFFQETEGFTAMESQFICGGLRNYSNYKFIPTVNTAVFLLAGEDRDIRSYYESIILDENILVQDGIISIRYPNPTELDPILILDLSYYNYFKTGMKPRLDNSPDFPAQLLETDMTPDDLVLDDYAKQKREIIMHYLKANMTLYSMTDTRKKISPGYVVLLYGPPGTGKTLTATLMGKELNIPVYKVSLSRVISKYIGETEKNLERVFSRLDGRNVILFFDEADALFGTRTEINDSKDRYANQEISYLLQRIERWNGLVILSTNYEQNMDEAFARRITLYMNIKMPGLEERDLLWRRSMPEDFQYESEELIDKLVQIDGFSGALIALIIKRACIEAVNMDTKVISKEILTSIVNEVGIKHDVIVKKILL